MRDWIEASLAPLSDSVVVEVPKSVLKQGAVQHLYGRLAARLKQDSNDAHLLQVRWRRGGTGGGGERDRPAGQFKEEKHQCVCWVGMIAGLKSCLTFLHCAGNPDQPPPASLQALHPTPAVCGRPRDQALGYLDAHERFDRGLYSGPFGWISGAGAEFVVAIRSALVQPDAVSPASGSGPSPSAPRHNVHLYAGVGVVLGSDPAEEWQELELKTRQYRQLLLPPRLQQLQAAAADPAAAIKARPLREWLRGLPNINLAWCSLLVEELCRQGVTMFCIAPGESVWGVCGCVRVCAGVCGCVRVCAGVCRGCLH